MNAPANLGVKKTPRRSSWELGQKDPAQKTLWVPRKEKNGKEGGKHL